MTSPTYQTCDVAKINGTSAWFWKDGFNGGRTSNSEPIARKYFFIIERALDELNYDSDNHIPHLSIRITVNTGDQGSV